MKLDFKYILIMIFLASCTNKNDIEYYSKMHPNELSQSINDESDLIKIEAIEIYHPDYPELSRLLFKKINILYEEKKFLELPSICEKFIKLYPQDEDIERVIYLQGMSYYHLMLNPDTDLTAAQKTIQILSPLINSKYHDDVVSKIQQANDFIAARELNIGKFYSKKSIYSAAIPRFQHVIQKHQSSTVYNEAIYRLIEIFVNLHQTKLANKNFKLFIDKDNIWYIKSKKLLSHE